MNDDFRVLNRRQRRKSDQWNYRIQVVVGSLAGLAIVVTIMAQIWIRTHHG